MFERRSSVIAFLVVTTLLTLPAAIAAQSTTTQEASASTAGDPQQPVLVGATLETYYQFNWNRVPNRTVPLRAYDTRANTFSLQHAGLRLTFPVHERLTAMYALTNGIQQTEEFNDFKSQQVALIVKPMARVTWTVNYYAGREQPDGGEPGGPDGRFTVFDTYATFTATSALTVGIDVNHTSNELVRSDPAVSLTGVGVYGRYQVASPFAVGLRYERLADEGLFGDIEQTLHEVTLRRRSTASRMGFS